MPNASSIAQQLTATNNQFNKAVGEKKGGDLDKESFLLLLVTQFKNQDPLNPMEDKEFISQLSQFSSLEQLMNLNTGMGSLTSTMESQQMINATSYIGKDVAAAGTTISKAGKDISIYRWAIGDNMASGSVNVYDSSNQLVATYALEARTAGTSKFEWDGKDYNGNEAMDGVYKIALSALDANGNPLMTDSLIDGTVQGVMTENGKTYLSLVDERVVDLANVRQVLEKKASDSKSGTGANGT